MKKNGFTLIELLATLVLMGIIASIFITLSVRKLNEVREKSRETMISSIELAAQNYAMNYGDLNDSFKDNDFMFVTLKELEEKDMFSNSLIDQTTKAALPLTDTVYVTRENTIVNAVYDINQKTHAKIILNGSYNTYVKKGTTFTDPGITATLNDSNVTSSVTTSGTVDTTKVGTYVITYTHSTTSITRNVIVY